jgi:hypothetical protein
MKVVISYRMEVPQQGRKKVVVVASNVTAFGETCTKAFEAGMRELESVEQKCGGFARSMAMSYVETANIEINKI